MLNDQTTASAPPDEAIEAIEPVDVDANVERDAASAEQLEHLLVLSQAPLSLDAALERETDVVLGASPLTAGRLIGQFVGLLGMVLGIGLITAAVRHYSTNPTLYLGLGAAGALLFATASTLAQRPAAGGWLARLGYAGLSVLLGLGLGLLVGGALHFSAFPQTAVVLVPLGAALSIGAFVVRDGRALLGRDLISAGITIAGLLVWLSVGLGMAAKKMDSPPANAGNAGNSGAAVGGDQGAVAGGDQGAAAAGDHGAAAAGDHGGAAKADAGTKAGEPGAAATGEHEGAAVPAADHGSAATEKGAAAADHGSAAAEKGAATEEHGATKTAAHGETAAGKEVAAKADDHPVEEEVTAEDVLGH